MVKIYSLDGNEWDVYVENSFLTLQMISSLGYFLCGFYSFEFHWDLIEDQKFIVGFIKLDNPSKKNYPF